MKLAVMFWLWLALDCFGSLVFPLRGASPSPLRRTFEGYQHGQKQAGNQMQYASFTSVTLVVHGHAFDIAGCVDAYHPLGEFFGGEGSIDKSGLIHFRWKDNFGQKGEGTIRVFDRGRSIDFRLVTSYPKRILRYTPEPEHLNICTAPSHYAAPLWGEYAGLEAYLLMEAKRLSKVAVTAQIDLYPDTLNRLSIKGTGTWGNENSLFFDFVDEEHDRGRGQIRFVGSAAPILTVHYPLPREAAKEKLARQFDGRQVPLKIAENRDKW
jgi:hypothetical protein